MKVILQVEIDDADSKFFADLMDGGYSWVSQAQLSFMGVGASPPPVDATWLLRANISFAEPNKL